MQFQIQTPDVVYGISYADDQHHKVLELLFIQIY